MTSSVLCQLQIVALDITGTFLTLLFADTCLAIRNRWSRAPWCIRQRRGNFSRRRNRTRTPARLRFLLHHRKHSQLALPICVSAHLPYRSPGLRQDLARISKMAREERPNR